MSNDMNMIAAIIFALALIHTFTAKSFVTLAHKHPSHAGLFHLLGEVEVVFGFWAFILIGMLALFSGGNQAITYVESRQYTEPLFIFVIMVVAASRPILGVVRSVVQVTASVTPINNTLAQIWLGLAVVPLLGSLITEPAAMTLAALILAPLLFKQNIPEWLKYVALGVLFVNISIGGTLTSYAAPPVLMVASAWQWDSAFMATTFGWKAAIAVVINASVTSYLLRKHIVNTHASKDTIKESIRETKIPFLVSLIHIMVLVGVVIFAHHPVIFFGLFLLFLGFTQAYERYQSPLILKEGLLVGFFLAGLVVLGGMQQWWLQPIVSSLAPLQLFFGATALTAITDNAALTYLGSLIVGITDEAKYMLMAGAVTGGGLTVIANAPNPAGAALLKHGFNEGSIGAGGLFLGALPPTIVAAVLFLI
jgi:Na+/H+ antiporter NhaD/arsenite permease-like protein